MTFDVLRVTATPVSPTGRGGDSRGVWPEDLGVAPTALTTGPPTALYSLQGEELAAKPQHLCPAGTWRGGRRHLRLAVEGGGLGGSRAPRVSPGGVPSRLLRTASVGPGP